MSVKPLQHYKVILVLHREQSVVLYTTIDLHLKTQGLQLFHRWNGNNEDNLTGEGEESF